MICTWVHIWRSQSKNVSVFILPNVGKKILLMHSTPEIKLPGTHNSSWLGWNHSIDYKSKANLFYHDSPWDTDKVTSHTSVIFFFPSSFYESIRFTVSNSKKKFLMTCGTGNNFLLSPSSHILWEITLLQSTNQ